MVFGGALAGQVLVVDRYSTYKKLARVLEGRVTLAWCWSHQRRDFIDCAAGQPKLSRWCQGWLGRIAAIYRLNRTRLSHCRADTGERDEGFAAVQRELESELAALFGTAERELKGLDVTFGPDTDPPLEPPPRALDEVRPIRLRAVLGGTPQSRQWNQFIARYHYLGYKTLVGAQMRYTVHDRHGRLLALLGFSTAARKLAPRDRFIGWTPALREKNLPKVIDNARFLILPWIEIPNLASHVLSAVCRQLIHDWTSRYNTTPVLIETFVETPRFIGTAYQASGWTHVGTTKGRGRYDRHKKYDKPKKAIWLRPLRKDWKRSLNR